MAAQRRHLREGQDAETCRHSAETVPACAFTPALRSIMTKPDDAKPIVVANPWGELRQFTPARIALGRAGTSLPTGPHLEFQLAHARARNAVHHELDVARLEAQLAAGGHETCVLHSAAGNRPTYLQRPDKGRR